MSKNRYNSIGVLAAIPLALFLWQGSSCRTSNANSNANSTMKANANTSSPSQSRNLRGTWGGQSISMDVSDSGAAIEWDCAHGRITEKIAPDGEGKFEAKGVFAPERGGPQRIEENNDKPAVYRGSIKDQTMTLTVELTKNKESVGTFTLTQGKQTRLRKCL